MVAETRENGAGRANGAQGMPETCPDTRAPLRRFQRAATEAEMQCGIKQAVELRGGRCWWVRDSRGLDVEDMPDLLIVAPWIATVALIEVKSQRRRVTPGQRHTFDLLSQCERVVSGIMRPVPREGELSYDDVLALLAGETQTGEGAK